MSLVYACVLLMLYAHIMYVHSTSWFQTSKDVTLTIFAKGTKRDTVQVNVTDRHIDITCPMADGSVFTKQWSLFAAIDVASHHMDHTPYKIELVLKKIVAEPWDVLESSVAVPVAVQKRENIYEGKLEAYPTSRPVKTNWTEVEKAAVKQEEEEKPEGEAALQKLFQSIYGGADEVRTASTHAFVMIDVWCIMCDVYACLHACFLCGVHDAHVYTCSCVCVMRAAV